MDAIEMPYDGQIIATIEKGALERLIVGTRSYRGRRFADVRVYWQDDAGNFKPSQKGVTLRGDQIEQMREALAQAGAILGKDVAP